MEGTTTTSYGMAVFSNTAAGPLFLLYKRRDSYEYIDIIKGLYYNTLQLSKLIHGLYEEEKERIKKFAFPDLWADLWVDHTTKTYKQTYNKARIKFENYTTQINNLILECRVVKHPTWEFPKGRRCKAETNTQCALREFTEETGINHKPTIFSSVKPITETYIGTDGKLYSTWYFMGSISPSTLWVAESPLLKASDSVVSSSPNRETVPVRGPETPDTTLSPSPEAGGTILGARGVNEEAADVKWMTYQEACYRLEPRRMMILKKINHRIIQLSQSTG